MPHILLQYVRTAARWCVSSDLEHSFSITASWKYSHYASIDHGGSKWTGLGYCHFLLHPNMDHGGPAVLCEVSAFWTFDIEWFR